MTVKVYDFELEIGWKLINLLSAIDRFDAQWNSLEKREGQSLKHLKSVATVQSVGASTRIEGSKMSDEEVNVLLQNIIGSKMESRDEQEVIGYFDVLDTITESYKEIQLNESSIKYLHNMLMKHSRKDEWHKGEYKQHSNAVEAVFADGTKQIIFQTTPAGYATEDAMKKLIEWYHSDTATHPLVKNAAFTYEFLSIHPFQDGNGRLSRLISALLLLKSGYNWIQYISFEHEIERRKTAYYRSLRNCQAERPNENITEWIDFFLESLKNVQQRLEQKVQQSGVIHQLAPREKSILTLIENYPGIHSGEISKKLNIPSPTAKRILADLVSKGIIEIHGKGRATSYSVI